MLIKTLALMLCTVLSTSLLAAPVETLTQACAQCHGDTGVSTQARTPHLNGQLSDYLEDDLRRLGNGGRVSTVPEHIPKSWTAEDVMAVADFYAASRSPRPAQSTDAALVAKAKAALEKQYEPRIDAARAAIKRVAPE